MPERDNASTAIVLDRYWDEVLAGDSGMAEGDLDPDLAATVRRVHALDARPMPSGRFASQLWEGLVHTEVDAISEPTGFLPSPLRLLEQTSAIPHHRFTGRSTATLSRIAAAVVLFALIAASAIAALYPLGVLNRDTLTIFAPAANPPTDIQDAVGKELLSLTFSEWPAMRTFGGLSVTDYPAGASSRERTRAGSQLFFVESGPMSLSVAEAAEPVRIIAPDVREDIGTSTLKTGDEADLPTGTAIVASPDSVLELFNTGTEPTRMLVLLGPRGGTSDGTARDGATWRWGSVGMPQDIAPPVSIDLRQVTVNPSAALPIPPTEMGVYSAAVLDNERVRDLSFAAGLGWRNTSFAPLEAYLLKITSGAS